MTAPSSVQNSVVVHFAEHEMKFDSHNVVSAVLPQGGSLFEETVRAADATRRSEWPRGDIKVATLDDTLLIWQTVPSWYHSDEEALGYDYRPLLNEFLTQDVELVKNRATFTGDFSHEVVSEAYLKHYRQAPNDLYEKRKATTAALLREEDAKIHLYLSPSVTYYTDSGIYLGHVNYLGGKPAFDTATTASLIKVQGVDPRHMTTLNWYKAPSLVEPHIALTASDAARTVTLTPREGARTLEALSQELKGQGLKFAPVDEKLANLSLFIAQRKDWTVGELLRSVCAVGGFEISSTANGYAWVISPAHEAVGSRRYTLALSRHEQREKHRMLAKIFARNGNKMRLRFNANLCTAPAPVRLDSLDAAVREKALEPLDEATRALVGQVWFTLDMTVAIRASLGGTITSTITPFAPKHDLNPPSDWKRWNEEEFWERYGAKVTF